MKKLERILLWLCIIVTFAFCLTSHLRQREALKLVCTWGEVLTSHTAWIEYLASRQCTNLFSSSLSQEEDEMETDAMYKHLELEDTCSD